MEYKLKIEDLQENHKEIASIIGLDNLIALSEHFGGTPLYIPQKDEIIKPGKYKAIAEEFNGYNIKKLARKHSVSESTVYRVVKSRIKNRPTRKMEGQMSFKDFEV